MATRIEFCVRTFCSVDVIPSNENFITTNNLLLIFRIFWLVTDWRNWETLLHYKGAIFGVLGLLGLLGYAILVGQMLKQHLLDSAYLQQYSLQRALV